jgi:quercetin dioxygenase-like cupin family protein
MFTETKNTKVEQLGGGVSRQILGHDAQLMMVRVDFAKGAIGAVHSHPHRQVSYVAAGKFEVQIGAEKKVLGVGDCFFATPDVKHGVVALEAGTLIDVFTPCREDFLKR